MQGKGYDTEIGEGRLLWQRVQAAQAAPSVHANAEDRYGTPILVLPRLGQGVFRVLVTDPYQRRCAVTGERTLPVLDAAHIKPYAMSGEHRLENGLLLRKDLHALFDAGYVTVTPGLELRVSRRIREDTAICCSGRRRVDDGGQASRTDFRVAAIAVGLIALLAWWTASLWFLVFGIFDARRGIAETRLLLTRPWRRLSIDRYRLRGRESNGVACERGLR